MDLTRYIRNIPDFPKPGIMFKDITPLLADAAALRWTIDHLGERYRGTVDIVRDFLLTSNPPAEQVAR